MHKVHPYLWRVPASDAFVSANTRERGEGALGLESLCEETVGAVGAGDCGQRTAGIVVAGVVGNFDELVCMF